MKLYTLRLHGNDDLRKCLQQFAKNKNIRAGFIISCVGAVKVLRIRMAGATHDQKIIKEFKQEFEIVSLSGTIEAHDCHLHISAARSTGDVIGGHLKNGTIIDITAEIVIGEDESIVYLREFDPVSHFEELVVATRDRYSSTSTPTKP